MFQVRPDLKGHKGLQQALRVLQDLKVFKVLKGLKAQQQVHKVIGDLKVLRVQIVL